MSVRIEQAGRIAGIVKCDYIYMTVISPLTGTSFANYKICKWDNLIVVQVTIISAIWRHCLNTILSVLTQWLEQAMLLQISINNGWSLKVWVGYECWNILLQATLKYCTHHLCMSLCCASLCLCCSSVFSTYYYSSMVLPVTNRTVVSTPSPPPQGWGLV
jgi:hypothetical protein